MLIEDDIRLLFLNKSNHQQFLIEYSKIANNLMFQNISFIQEVTSYLTDEIVKHSKKHDNAITTKTDLLNKREWYIDDYNAFENETSGSTGKPFKYLIWKDIYNNIECDNHYKDIINEFMINRNKVKVLYLHYDITDPNTDELITIYKTHNPVVSHGLLHRAEIHSAIANHTFYMNYYKYYEKLIQYIIENDIDVIHAQSNSIYSLAWNVKRLGVRDKLCKLLSNTGSKLDISKVNELKNNGNIDNWCDHMRCWDGGATFFTCRYNTYHLLDSLAWTYTDDYKLLSYDYFSLPSPFVRYWNGDYAEIGNEYNRCKCGRAYRKFQMGRTRSKISQVSELSSIQNKLSNNDLLDGLKRVEVIQRFMRIFTKYSLPSDQKQYIRELFKNIEIQFTVEEDE